MHRNVTVVHIEDEYEDLTLTWPRRFNHLLNTYLSEKGLPTGMARPKTPDLPELASVSNIAVRDFASLVEPAQLFRYIFLGDIDFPEELEGYLSDINLFIVDVLRSNNGGGAQQMTALQSIDSVFKRGGTIDNTVVFTALQGNHLTDIRNRHPKIEIISKLNPELLDRRFVKLLRESQNDD